MKQFVVIDPENGICSEYDTLEEAKAETEGDHLHNGCGEQGLGIYKLLYTAKLKAEFQRADDPVDYHNASTAI
jgi:hypothetical protein